MKTLKDVIDSQSKEPTWIERSFEEMHQRILKRKELRDGCIACDTREANLIGGLCLDCTESKRADYEYELWKSER